MEMFVDKVRITVCGGKGGDGAVAFHREKYVASGGPDGGDGGHGGSVILRVNDNLSTLLDFRYKRKYVAQGGVNGLTRKCNGKRGANLIIQVPRGTVVRDAETNAIIASALEKNDIVLTGPLQMKSVNIYDARCKDNYITSRFFLMYVENNQDKVIRGNFVIKMRDEKIIDKVYRWPEKE